MLFDLDLTEPIGLVIGSEGDGVSPAVLRKVDRQFIIPQKGTTDSLNVSVATGMMLYETMRQRKAPIKVVRSRCEPFVSIALE